MTWSRLLDLPGEDQAPWVVQSDHIPMMIIMREGPALGNTRIALVPEASDWID
jgi:hypothetical protein